MCEPISLALTLSLSATALSAGFGQNPAAERPADRQIASAQALPRLRQSTKRR